MTHVQVRPLQPQTLLGGRYRLEREIGRGGMAIVWLAQDLKLSREVAVKVLLGELAFAMGPERFRREIDVVSRLSHPNILPIDDYGEVDGQLYYVMPFISGETIQKRLERERQLNVQEAVRIAAEVASALDYAHRQGIVHRDIKPENILLQDGEALVADFGIARAITDGGGAKLTSTGVTLGTPTYMSPEQAMADPNIDGRSDIYSLGCVLYEMLAGQPPFSGPTAQAIIARHQLDEAPSLTIVRGTIPEEVEDVVMQALAKLPADRYADAGEMADELKRILGTGARPAKVSERRRVTKNTTKRGLARAKAARRPYVIGGWVLGGLAVAAGGVFAAMHFAGGGSAAPTRIGSDSDPNHIAVLYFDDRSEGGKLRFLADGFTEALIDELSTVKQLKVISRNGVAPFKGKSIPPDSVQRALKVGTLVTGKVEQSGDQLRLTVALVDALTGDEKGKKVLEAQRADVFKLQDNLAQEVALVLRKALGQIDEMDRSHGTSNASAWEAFQRSKQTLAGVDTILAMGDVQAAVKRLSVADSELVQVQAMDKKWAAPVVARGWIPHRKVLLLGFGDPSQVPKWLDQGARLADSAIAIAPKSADALELRATIRFFRWLYNLEPDPTRSTKLLADAEADYKAALAINPLQATAWNGLSFLLNLKAQFSEAKLAAASAYNSDPYLKDVDKTIWRLFQNSLALGDRIEAEKWCNVGRERLPDNSRFTECRLWLYAMEGPKPNVDSVWAAYRELVKRSPASRRQLDSLTGGMGVAAALVRAGLPDSARAVATRSRGNSQVDPGSELVDLEAKVRAQLGDKADAIKLMTRFFAANPQQRAFAKNDESWWWKSLRDDPQFKALVGGGT
jgi:eukaryotic-like serine/threonine-protein kinase